jgi:C4-dicarboxylate-specific signal transduction histidine kinase
VDVLINPQARFVWGDPVDLRQLFYHTLENAVEAACSAKEPYVRISSTSQEIPPHSISVEIFNSGDVINLANIANILTPFYSTKAWGSGLGLSIAKLAARKNYGSIDFAPLPQSGTKVFITLQRAASNGLSIGD